MKKGCFPGANPYLTFHCASQGTILIDLAPDDKEYQSVEEEVSELTVTPHYHHDEVTAPPTHCWVLLDAEHHQRTS